MVRALADSITSYDALSLAEAIRTGALSSEQVIAAYLERIERLNRCFNALVTVDQERALRSAREADAELRDGRTRGPLHGVPVTIKDALLTAGLRTTAGHPKYAQLVPDADAWVVDRLKRAGAIVIGKTNCAALCSDVQTTNEVFGATNNPWSVGRTAGGSSGGEAAAVALGMSPLGIGSDTAGSIRIPSSYCGVFGLKTSIGKIPRDGHVPLHDETHARPDSLTVIGPIARSIRDLTLCYEVLTGESTTKGAPPASPRIFWTQDFTTQVIDEEVARALDEMFSVLTRAGADVRKVAPPFPLEELFSTYMRLYMFEFAPEDISRALLPLFFVSEAIRSPFRGGARGSYERLKRKQSDLKHTMDEFLQACDCWILPATPSTAFVHQKTGRGIPVTSRGRTKKLSYWEATMGLTYPFNLLGNPSVVIPLVRGKEGMPIGVQVVGRLGEDRKLLSVAEHVARKIGAACWDPPARLGSSLEQPPFTVSTRQDTGM
ncbi:amidase [Sorangium sp. So ce429]